MDTRKIIEIDEALCDGCGNCIPSCAEGALAIVDGKARIVKDIYCDGLGACLGHCPQGALRIIERPAEAFDEEAAMAYVRATRGTDAHPAPHGTPATLGCGCPGSAMQDFGCPSASLQPMPEGRPAQPSMLTHWPLKLRLIPAEAPFLKGAELLLAADCAPPAHGGFHAELLAGRKLLLACPKFEDNPTAIARLADILRVARPAGLTVVRMEVPCCAGLSAVARAAVHQAAQAGVVVPLREVVLTRQGTVAAPTPVGA